MNCNIAKNFNFLWVLTTQILMDNISEPVHNFYPPRNTVMEELETTYPFVLTRADCVYLFPTLNSVTSY